MVNPNRLVKSAWIAAEVSRDKAEKVLVVEAYIAVSPLEGGFDADRYGRLVEDVRRILADNPDIDRASILSVHRESRCAALFRRGACEEERRPELVA
ncbi:hypothetical protein [Methylobacterium nonmethylotrophicum]|uniref:Uncharacterized protein n=1 Tax=Methylobacterium nonmethylotrophicum TaxID=1141884 RepID=A0A4Z0NT94_9HYPH|nr:hypothetical protein [Methylobacterium nonmethylotrophicum]TGE00104.1 hypothetical protein EU555_09295 [Methylobacterium nonmethylotrophicum]